MNYYTGKKKVDNIVGVSARSQALGVVLNLALGLGLVAMAFFQI